MAESHFPSGKHEVTIEVDEALLAKVNDETLAFWWRLAQHNPADQFADKEPGQLAMRVGWEIIRRWLKGAPVEMYRHQQENYYWDKLRRVGKWNAQRQFVPHTPVADPALMISAFQEAELQAKRIGEHQQAAAYERARAALEETMRATKSSPGEQEASDA